jgi:superfamily I DNA/RNA helicase
MTITIRVSVSEEQLALVRRPVESKVFLQGPAGSGKTTGGVQRMLHLLDSGVPAEAILVLVPQRTLATPYYEALHSPDLAPGGQVTVLTMGGLARRMVDLFWPLVAEEAGFSYPDRKPTFLTLETAQYYMARVVRPLLEQGYFESLVIDRNRLYSQIIDDLNKAAVVGFPHTEIGERLKSAWGGDPAERRIYDEAQECAMGFRQYCLAHNLLDFSLQMEVFVQYLWTLPLCRGYLVNRYTHLLVDNVEEDTPVAHDLLRDWLPHCQSTLLIYDEEAGYRRFLSADPESAQTLSALCDETVTFGGSFVTSPEVEALASRLAQSFHKPAEPVSGDVLSALGYEYHHYHPQMLDWVADEIGRLVGEEGVSPGEIAVLAPFLTDALRFSLVNRLEQRGVPARSHRPSRALREEPAARCLLTLACIAHPQWGRCPSRFDVAYTLMSAIEELDLVRAQLLAEIAYRPRDGVSTLGSFDLINSEMQERLTFLLGGRYENLRLWIDEYVGGPEAPLDHFLSRLFGEVLSQEGYGFHRNYDAGEVAANLIESVQKFRWVTEEALAPGEKPLGQEYVEMVGEGVVAAQYVRSWRLQPEDAVLLAPAYTFLMANRPVDYQFWLNAGGRGWWERLYQPLTHPYVLSRHWPRDTVWTDEDECESRQEALYRLTRGLLHRCRKKIYLGISELGEQGFDQQGALLQAMQRVLRHVLAEAGSAGPGRESDSSV